jgi:glycosyltransferase involved in cell wall biosynthesis
MGGFGWAARQVARVFEDRRLGVDVVFLTGEIPATPGQDEIRVHGRRLVLRQRGSIADVRRVRAERIDLLLTMDYRPNYRTVCWALPRTPMIVWVRDPRDAEDVARVHTLRIPGADGLRPQGTFQPDCASLGTLVRASRWLARPVIFASPAPHLRDRLARMIGMAIEDLALLPNPVDIDPGAVRKSAHPQVVCLARLDPVKRPWLVVALARRFPHVEFLFAGKAHYRGEGAWEASGLPPNVRLLGHIDGPDKVRLLSSAWVLVNTSIHEGGVAVSFLEALACETPLLACVDAGGLVSRFGIHTRRRDGDGVEALPSLAEGLERLLSDHGLRRRLGREGRRWVSSTHNPVRFLEAFRTLSARAGVRF